MKFILGLLFLLNLFPVAYGAEDYVLIGTLKKVGNSWELVHSQDGQQVPYVWPNEEMKGKILALKSGEEAVFRGHVHYETITRDGKISIRPILLIESLSPISLHALGEVTKVTDAEVPWETLKLADSDFKPVSIPVTNEVVSAMVLTSTVFLMQSLTATPAEVPVQQQLSSGLVIMAGSIATLMCIIDQIQGKTK